MSKYEYSVGEYTTDKTGESSGIDKIDSRLICVDGRLQHGTLQYILCSFALDKRLGRKLFRNCRIKLRERIKKFH